MSVWSVSRVKADMVSVRVYTGAFVKHKIAFAFTLYLLLSSSPPRSFEFRRAAAGSVTLSKIPTGTMGDEVSSQLMTGDKCAVAGLIWGV